MTKSIILTALFSVLAASTAISASPVMEASAIHFEDRIAIDEQSLKLAVSDVQVTNINRYTGDYDFIFSVTNNHTAKATVWSATSGSTRDCGVVLASGETGICILPSKYNVDYDADQELTVTHTLRALDLETGEVLTDSYKASEVSFEVPRGDMNVDHLYAFVLNGVVPVKDGVFKTEWMVVNDKGSDRDLVNPEIRLFVEQDQDHANVFASYPMDCPEVILHDGFGTCEVEFPASFTVGQWMADDLSVYYVAQPYLIRADGYENPEGQNLGNSLILNPSDFGVPDEDGGNPS